jgi:DNA polymerase-3 subunit gamma/tau
MIKAFNAAATDLRGGWQPSLSLELALAEVMEKGEGDRGKGEEASKPTTIVVERPTERLTVKTVETPTKKIADWPESKSVDRPVSKAAEKPAEKTSHASAQEAEKPALKTASKPGETTGGISLEQLMKAWKQIRELIKPKSRSLDGLLNSCRLLEVKNGVLVIGFASELLRSKVDTPELIEITRKAILEVCGADLAIKCVVTNAKQATPPNVKADGMVAAALKHGGEIVDTQE